MARDASEVTPMYNMMRVGVTKIADKSIPLRNFAPVFDPHALGNVKMVKEDTPFSGTGKQESVPPVPRDELYSVYTGQYSSAPNITGLVLDIARANNVYLGTGLNTTSSHSYGMAPPQSVLTPSDDPRRTVFPFVI